MSVASSIQTEEIISYNPATGAEVGRVVQTSAEDVTAAVTPGRTAFQTWKQTSFKERAACIMRAREVLLAEKGKEGMRQKGLARERAILFGYSASHACAASRRHHQNREIGRFIHGGVGFRRGGRADLLSLFEAPVNCAPKLRLGVQVLVAAMHKLFIVRV